MHSFMLNQQWKKGKAIGLRACPIQKPGSKYGKLILQINFGRIRSSLSALRNAKRLHPESAYCAEVVARCRSRIATLQDKGSALNYFESIDIGFQISWQFSGVDSFRFYAMEVNELQLNEANCDRFKSMLNAVSRWSHERSLGWYGLSPLEFIHALTDKCNGCFIQHSVDLSSPEWLLLDNRQAFDLLLDAGACKREL